MDDVLKRELDWVKSEQLSPKEDWDWINLNIGKERSGKSALGVQMAHYVDPTITVERIVFTAEEFERAVRKAKNGQAIIFDEGIEGFFSKESMSGATRSLNKLLAIIGYKHLFIVINIPSWNMVESHLKERSKSLIKVFVMRDGMKLKRGYYALYSKQSIEKIERNSATKKVLFPYPDYKGNFKDINNMPELKNLWKNYSDKKHKFGSVARSERVWKRKLKNEEQMKKSFSLNDIASINNASMSTVRNWLYMKKIFPKKAVFKDIFGEVRISEKDYDKYMKKFMDMRQKQKRGVRARKKQGKGRT